MNDLGLGDRVRGFSYVSLMCGINGMFSRGIAVELLKSDLKLLADL